MSEACPHFLKPLFLFSSGGENAHQKSLGSLFGFPLVSTQHAATVLQINGQSCVAACRFGREYLMALNKKIKEEI